MKFNYHFVKKGEVAPLQINLNEFWLDVGNRVDLGVIDHHHGDRKEWSAAELLKNKYKELIILNIDKTKDVSIFLHEGPDLDAIFCTWLLKIIIKDNLAIENDMSIRDLINVVSENDQGYSKSIEPKKNWAVVFRTILNTTENQTQSAIVDKGLELIDETYKLLNEGKSLVEVAKSILTFNARVALEQGYRDYQDDLQRGLRFQVRLPKRFDWENKDLTEEQKEIHLRGNVRWSLADAIYLKDPKSLLFKELARTDKANSKLGLGFSLMIIARSRGDHNDNKLTQYIISTDPISGLHLEGLGRKLENLEQEFENKSNEKLLQGRERVEEGKGRFGGNVVSPWYDGRGHSYTVVDSPSIVINENKMCASQLNINDIFNAIWDYGDPARFINVNKSSISILIPVKIKLENTFNENEVTNLKDIINDLSDEVLQTFTRTGFKNTLKVVKLFHDKNYCIDGFTISSKYLVHLNNDEAVVVAKLDKNDKCNLRQLNESIKIIRNLDLEYILPNDFDVTFKDDITWITSCRLNSSDISFENIKDHLSELLYRISSDYSNDFNERPHDKELDKVVANLSPNHKHLFYATSSGYGLFAIEDVKDEKNIDFVTPIKFSMMSTLVLLQKITLRNLYLNFIEHRSVTPTNKKIINDRWTIMKIDQILFYKTVTRKPFGQRSYEIIREVMAIDQQFTDTKYKIESLAEITRDSRSDFLQLIGTVITVIIAPFALTAGFFSGTHMEKDFGKTHYAILPNYEFAGWLQFAVVFIISMGLSYGIYILMQFLFYRKSKKNKY